MAYKPCSPSKHRNGKGNKIADKNENQDLWLNEKIYTLNKPRTKVSFRIFAPGLDPGKVTQVLGLTPDKSHLEGDYPANNPKYSPSKYGMWSLQSKLSVEESLAVHLESLLFILEPKQEQILRLGENNTIDFYCGLFSQIGFQLSPAILKKIAHLGAGLGVAFYPIDE